MQLTVTVEEISPTIAQSYLETMRFNRPLDPEQVSDYAKKMRSGEWNDLSRYLEFTTEGDFINGQHRLHAVIVSNTIQRFAVVRGLPTSTR